MAETKAEKYRAALTELGADTKFADFVAFLGKKFKMDEKEIAQSAFYTEKGKMYPETKTPRKAAASKPTKAAVAVEAAPKGETIGLSMSDLPGIIGQAKDLLEKFGGDKDALAKVVKAL